MPRNASGSGTYIFILLDRLKEKFEFLKSKPKHGGRDTLKSGLKKKNPKTPITSYTSGLLIEEVRNI